MQLRATQLTKAASFQPISLEVPYGVLSLSARVYSDNNEMKFHWVLVHLWTVFVNAILQRRGRISCSKYMEVKDSKCCNALVEN